MGGIYEDQMTRTFGDLDEKATAAAGDMVLIADSEDENRARKVPISEITAGSDSTAIHDNIADEIHSITEKAAPVGDDVLIAEDSADAWDKVRLTLQNAFGAIGLIVGLTAKAAPVAADVLAINDSAAAGAAKKSTLQQLFGALGLIDGLTSKAAPIAADTIAINDSAAAGAAKKATIGSIPVAQAQVVGILLEPTADAAVALLNTTAAVRATVTAAGTVVISTSSRYAGQRIQFFASAVSGGGSYTLAVQGGTLTINATGEAPVVMRNAADSAWVVISLGGATIV
jgi:hypothetical protein